MKRFPQSAAKRQALNICITQYTVVEGEGAERWLRNASYGDSFGDPIICTAEDLDWAMDYLWERCHKVGGV